MKHSLHSKHKQVTFIIKLFLKVLLFQNRHQHLINKIVIFCACKANIRVNENKKV